jgi:hypothetical protein
MTTFSFYISEPFPIFAADATNIVTVRIDASKPAGRKILRGIVSQFTLIRKATKAAVTAPHGATFA